MRIILLILVSICAGCTSTNVDLESLQEKLLIENQYIDNIASDILCIENLDKINARISKIESILDDPSLAEIKNFEQLKKEFKLKIKLLQRIISYGAICCNSLDYVRLHKNDSTYRIINIKSVNIDNELTKLYKLPYNTINSNMLHKHYIILLKHYKDYKYLLNKSNKLDIKSLIYKLHYPNPNYSFIYTICIIVFLLAIIIFVLYKINRSNMRCAVILLISFLLLIFIVYHSLKYNYHQRELVYKQRYLDNALNNCKVIENTNKIMAQLIFDGYINKPIIKQLFKKQDRLGLYNYLKSDYEKLKNKYSIFVIQFHLRDTTSFLRMNDPGRFGDQLGNIRESVNYVNNTFKTYSGYEVGRIKGAFRNVFALTDNKDCLGSVEISFSVNFFIRQYLSNHKDTKINFLINGNNLLPSVKNYFKPSSIDGFFYDKSVLNDSQDKNVLQTNKHKRQENLKLISKKIKLGKPFVVYFSNVQELVAIIPIKDKFTNQVVSVIQIDNIDKEIGILKQEFYRMLLVVISAIFILFLFIYKQIVAKYNLEIKIDKALYENTKHLQALQHQSKLAQMGEMIGAIAHQWRQPLNAISTSIQNLKYDYQDGYLQDKKFIHKFIETNKTTIKFMSKTIDDFRSFFRVDKQKYHFQIKEATQSVINMQSTQLSNNGIIISLDGDDFSFYGFPGEYQQVILNIINNAKDALIDKTTARLLIKITIQDKKIMIKDNAGGIPKHIINRIFEPYFTTKEQGKGTGMGLYMSKMIVEDNMGGKLTVYNEQDGACFCIDFS